MRGGTMTELQALLYGELGILHRIESGDEDRVVQAEKWILLDLAKKANRKYHDGTLSVEEMMIYVDVFDVFASFQQVDWIRELTAELHSALTRGVNLAGEG